MPNKIMLDIETLGTKPGCIVRELGIVVFNETKILKSYQYFFDTKSQEEKGLITEWDTAQWVLDGHYFNNDTDSLKTILDTYPKLGIFTPKKGMLLEQNWVANTDRGIYTDHENTLEDIFSYYTPINKDTEIWANGSTFDIPILEHFFKTFGLESPFKYYYNIRDFRTIKRFFNFDGKSIPDEPFPHLAVSDCFWQVKALQAIYKQQNIG